MTAVNRKPRPQADQRLTGDDIQIDVVDKERVPLASVIMRLAHPPVHREILQPTGQIQY